MSVRKWANVAVAMQTAEAATVAITAITQANPGVATSTNTFTAGDYALLSVQGMYQLDQRVVRIATPSSSAFTLDSLDTTKFDTFTSGTAGKLTFGQNITSATSMTASGGDFAFIDVTTIHTNVKAQIPGLANPMTYTFENLWDITDAGQIAMKAATDAQSQLAFKFTFGTGGPIMVFSGYVGFTGAPGGNAQDKVTSQAVITMFGRPTFYAS